MLTAQTYNEIVHRIHDEQKAIRDYRHLLFLIEDGSDKRSIQHILKEEKDHEIILRKMLEKNRGL